MRGVGVLRNKSSMGITGKTNGKRARKEKSKKDKLWDDLDSDTEITTPTTTPIIVPAVVVRPTRNAFFRRPSRAMLEANSTPPSRLLRILSPMHKSHL